MLASVVSSFTHQPERLTDEYLYQSLVIQRLMIVKDAQTIPIGTETSHFLTLDHTNPNALRVINTRIQTQINSSDIIYLAIDRGLTEKMLARSIEAINKNPNIKIKFFTLLGNDNIVGQLVTAMNQKETETEMVRLEQMIGHLKGLYLRNKLIFNEYGDLTNYKNKYYKFLKEIGEEQSHLMEYLHKKETH